MWYWEVIYQNTSGCRCSIYSLEGYSTERKALEALYDADEQINEALKKYRCAFIIDEQVVFKMTPLY